MVVINASGLIGKVVNVTAFTADVRLITTSDTNNKISVSIINDEKKINGLINNYDYNKKVLEVEGISNTEEVMIDDIVYEVVTKIEERRSLSNHSLGNYSQSNQTQE